MSPPAVDTIQGLSYMNVPEAVFLWQISPIKKHNS